jgi:hypothetical protein
MFFKKRSKSNDPIVILREKVEILIDEFDDKDVPHKLLGPLVHDSAEDIEDFEDYLREHRLEIYLNDKEKQWCTNHNVSFASKRYNNILKTISRGFEEFIKHNGQPSADDLMAKTYAITGWRLFYLFHSDILKGYR